MLIWACTDAAEKAKKIRVKIVIAKVVFGGLAIEKTVNGRERKGIFIFDFQPVDSRKDRPGAMSGVNTEEFRS